MHTLSAEHTARPRKRMAKTTDVGPDRPQAPRVSPRDKTPLSFFIGRGGRCVYIASTDSAKLTN